MLAKQKIAVGVLAALAALSLTACSGEPPQGKRAEMPQKLTIEFSTNPVNVRAGQESELIVRVSAGQKPVTDADVELEILQDGQTLETLQTTPQDGAYKAKKKFEAGGHYQVIVHTTTSELHQMPTYDLTVLEK